MLEKPELVEYIPDSLAESSEAACVQQLRGRRWWLKRLSAWGVLGAAGAATYWAPQPSILPLYFDGRHALAHVSHPAVVHHLVAYANQLVDKPYKWGGGHKVLFDTGYDCSGSISHVLHRAGLMPHPANSVGFQRFGLPGQGRYVTIFVRPGNHVFMEVCGLRFDTSGTSGRDGPRWRVASRNKKGFLARHPTWL